MVEEKERYRRHVSVTYEVDLEFDLDVGMRPSTATAVAEALALAYLDRERIGSVLPRGEGCLRGIEGEDGSTEVAIEALDITPPDIVEVSTRRLGGR